MKKRWNLWSLFAGLVFLVAGCAPSAHVERDETTDFSRFKTFAWIDRDGKDKSDKNRNNDLTEQKVKAAVSKELERSAGSREVKNNPDVLLSYDVLVERGVRQQSEAMYSQPFSRVYYNPYRRRYFSVFYPSRFMGYDNYNVPTREGTVTITMIDADTDKTVWQGWATDEVNNRQMTEKEIQQSVRAIFKKFDIAKR